MHRTLCKAFVQHPEKDPAFRAKVGLLWRVDSSSEGVPLVLVQTRIKPEWSFLDHLQGYLLDDGRMNPGVRSLAPLLEQIREGALFRFCLRANPTKKIDTLSKPDGKHRNGRRIPLIGEENQIPWLCGKGTAHGFEILTHDKDEDVPPVPAVRVIQEPHSCGQRRELEGKEKLTFHAVRFEGCLKVTDRDSFIGGLEGGIGSAKAYGFGLLSVIPIKP
jgi:CRISPR system Cascade subunit CasE